MIIPTQQRLFPHRPPRKANASSARRRRYSRDYMRRWRADPCNRNRERGMWQRWGFEQKCREASEPARPVCALCHRRTPVMKVPRLQPARGGYVEVLVPYCGVC